MRRDWGAILFGIGLACSASSDGPMQSAAQAISGTCGAIAATVDFGSSGATGGNPLTQSTKLFVPSKVDFSSNDRFYPIAAGQITMTANFDGGIKCTYTVALPATGGAVPASPALFSGCSNGDVPGDAITTSSLTLTGAYTPNGEDATFHATATLGVDIDDGLPCTDDVCTNGVITHPKRAANTVVDTGEDACSVGIAYCDGIGGVRYGPALSQLEDDGNPCTTDTCSDGTIHNAPVSGCGVPSGTVPSYPGGGTVPSDISQGMQFLYGSQAGINTAAMDPKRLSVIRGRVVDRDSQSPIAAGVSVSILNHPEFGTAATRSDGWYDIVVNGGGSYVVQYTASGYVTAQRSVETHWLDWSVVADVAMVAPDPTKAITLGGSTWDYVRGVPKSDVDGSRTATVLIPPYTSIASCAGTVGCTNQAWTGGNPVQMHATEFTVGDNGPSAMPGLLPPQSGYTYAVDTGIILNGQPIDTSITFSQDVIFYIENFLTVDTAKDVPYGSYDKTRGLWQPETPGKVYCILDLNGPGGEARLGYDCKNEIGTGDAGGAYGTEWPPITTGSNSELAELATVYATAIFPCKSGGWGFRTFRART